MLINKFIRHQYFFFNLLWIFLLSNQLPNTSATELRNFVRGSIQISDRCKNPNQKSGICKSIYNCPSLLSALEITQTAASPTQLQFIRQSQCHEGFGRFPLVCCTADRDFVVAPSSASTKPIGPVVVSPSNRMGNVLPQAPNCGKILNVSKNFRGNYTGIEEYPWTVLLEYVERSGRRILNCGGSLINQRYILTAAHCVTRQIEIEVGALTTVRLGEYDTSTEMDCVPAGFSQDCNEKIVELGIEEVVVHPQYNSASTDRHHDIALVRLNADVNYNDFISPICLPLATKDGLIDSDELLTVAGWGHTLKGNGSDVKQHADAKISDFHECQRQYESYQYNLSDSQICAANDLFPDACFPDSGGPLMRIDEYHWYLVGIVSLDDRCNKAMPGVPDVFTRVASYIDWIRQNMKQ